MEPSAEVDERPGQSSAIGRPPGYAWKEITPIILHFRHLGVIGGSSEAQLFERGLGLAGLPGRAAT